MPAREFTPEEKAAGARAVLAELRRLNAARIDCLMLAGGVREIVDHYGLPWPLALATPGTLDSLAAISAAVDEYAGFINKNFPTLPAGSELTAGAGDAAAPAVALAA